MKWLVGRNRRSTAGVSYEPEAVTLFAAMATDPGATRKGLYNDLILGLKNDGLWTKIDVLYVFAAHEAATALLNIKQPGTFNATVAGATSTHTVDKGYTFTSFGHLTSNYNPATAGGAWTLDSAHMYGYVNQTTDETANLMPIVGTSTTASTGTWLHHRDGSSRIAARINSATTSWGTGTDHVATRIGGSAATRTAAGATGHYRDGVSVATDNDASSAIQSETIWVGRYINNYNYNDRIAAVSMGGGLNATDALNLHTRIHTFLAAINAAMVPRSTAAPVISGTTTVGETLSTTNGTWVNSPTSYSYQWMRNGVDIGGATGSSYTLVGADETTNISVRVVGTSANGSGLAATSASVGPIAGASYDADASTLFAAMTTDPGATRKGLYNDLIVGLKADSLWTKIDALYIFAAHEWQTALLNCKAPGTYNASEVNTPTFTQDLGYKATGTAYIDTNFNPFSASSPNHVQNSGTLYGYINQVTSDAGSTVPLIGNSNGSGTLLFIRPRNASDYIDTRLHSVQVSSFFSVTTRLGGTAASRTASTTSQGYRNGTAVGSTSSAVSSAPTNHTITVLRYSAIYNTNDRVAAMVIAGGMDATEHSNLHSRISTFLTAIGAN
jgi:hypothetical protein